MHRVAVLTALDAFAGLSQAEQEQFLLIARRLLDS